MPQKIKQMTYAGMFIALVALCTMVVHLPVPATNGYIHVGDSMILLIAYFYGSKYGMIAGGIGSALADILTGYAHWALLTLIVKGLMGFLVGKLCASNKPLASIQNLFGLISGEVLMVFGYFLGGIVMKGSAIVALQSVPADLLQGSGGIVIFLVVGAMLKKTGIPKIVSTIS